MNAAAPIADRTEATLAAGLAQHQAGRLDAAAACYRTVLAADAGHAEALHRLGLVAYQQGRPAEAAALIDRSLACAPRDAGAHNNLALVQMALGRHAEAVASCEQAIALRPDHAGALSNRGIALRALGRAAEAAASFRRALALRPDLPEAQTNLGLALADLGQREAALACHDRALALRPDYAEALSNRGVALLALGRDAEALPDLDRAAALRPDLPDIFCNRGNVLRALGRNEASAASYARAVTLRPDYPEALANEAAVLVELERPEAALASIDRALALDPALAGAHVTRATALLSLDRPAEALASAERALALAPDLATAHAAHGGALAGLRRMAEAQESYARASALAPDNRDFATSAVSLALRLGRLAEGWVAHEWHVDQWETRADARKFRQPRWRGEPLEGRTLLLYCDQGYGDTIQFIRYLPMLAGRGHVVLEVQLPLLPLLPDVPGASQVIAFRDTPPPFDLRCPMITLPGIFHPSLDALPPPPDWIRPDPGRVARWAAHLPDNGKLRVGLAWSGNPEHVSDHTRTMTLAALRPLAGCGADLYVMHKQVRDADRDEIGRFPKLLPLSDGFADFADTAAALLRLDLLIAVDTSVAHLAATLGVPTWIMIAAMPDWRWLLERDDSPWYPSVRLFRQHRRGDWADVVRRVRAALDGVLAAHRPPERA